MKKRILVIEIFFLFLILFHIKTTNVDDGNEERENLIKKCPREDKYCLNCASNICIQCAESYWNPAIGICTPPLQKIPNCNFILIFILYILRQYRFYCIFLISIKTYISNFLFLKSNYFFQK